MAELKKYTHDVFKQKDLLEYLTNEQIKHYMEISYAIMQGRMAAGKNPENHYLVCNTDEPYADRIRKAILDGEDEKAGVKPKCEYCTLPEKYIDVVAYADTKPRLWQRIKDAVQVILGKADAVEYYKQ